MDKKEILKQLGDIPESVYDEIVLGFYDETRSRLKLISEAIDSSNWSVIDKLAHSIKGSSANLRLISIQKIAESLQEAVRLNNHELIKENFENLKTLVPSV